jgi:hypothetical protein
MARRIAQRDAPMIGRLLLALAVAAGMVSQQTPLFRANGRAVFVPVSVTAGNKPIAGLTAADFDLTDAGVPQQINEVTYEEVPIDVTLFVDNSTSTFGSHEQFNRDIKTIVSLLRPVDRVRIVAFGVDVRVVMDWTVPGRRIDVPVIGLARLSSVYDGLYLSMLHSPPLGRRHLIVAMTDGEDFGSVVRSQAVEDLAGRIEGVVHLLLVTSRPNTQARTMAPGVAGTPPDLDGPEHLQRAAERSGGVAHSLVFSINVADLFKRAFDDFRTSYVLAYTPAGVPGHGWHDIKVGVKRPGRIAVRHRQGYFEGSDPR